MKYIVWIPLLCFLNLIQPWLTVQNNTHGGKWFWIYCLFSLGAVFPWLLISRESKDLTFDALIYDIIVMIFYYGGILLFTGCIHKLSNWQFIGLGLVMLGMIIFKKGI
jgi:hypothetical protein